MSIAHIFAFVILWTASKLGEEIILHLLLFFFVSFSKKVSEVWISEYSWVHFIDNWLNRGRPTKFIIECFLLRTTRRNKRWNLIISCGHWLLYYWSVSCTYWHMRFHWFVRIIYSKITWHLISSRSRSDFSCLRIIKSKLSLVSCEKRCTTRFPLSSWIYTSTCHIHKFISSWPRLLLRVS